MLLSSAQCFVVFLLHISVTQYVSVSIVPKVAALQMSALNDLIAAQHVWD